MASGSEFVFDECAFPLLCKKSKDNPVFAEECAKRLGEAKVVFDAARAHNEGREFSVLDLGSLGYDQYHRVMPRECPVCGESGDPVWAESDGKTPFHRTETVVIVKSDYYDEWREFLFCPTCGWTVSYISFDPM